jgi:HK97 family phage prohead protease
MSEERRITAGELRVDQQEGSLLPVIRGYAIVFNALSEDLGGFRELVDPRAVKRTLEEKVDLRAFIDHNPERIIGRLSAGTLRVRADKVGLAVEIDPPDTSVGRDLVVSLRRRDLTGMSFSFRTFEDAWNFKTEPPTRTLLDMRMGEVSVVAMPAYPDTAVAVRAMAAAQAARRPVGRLQRELRQRMSTWR